ncbi:MAG: FtsQ-type POTRA domain-containing protein [Candidatus Aminicenantes bacterium]|nr:MAG: FtsQ-type POTRA domain-containing protein [Candidatus Aminicenantes bacterium]
MAVSSIFSQQTSYRRKRGKIATKKIHRKIKLKWGHMMIAFMLLVGFFYGFSRLYLLFISWEKFVINKVEIICQKQEIRKDFQHYFEKRYLGNILLLDIENLQEQLAKHTWIKDVHIRKLFPSTIRIEATERIPIALLEKEGYFLIDKDGILLQKISPSDKPDLPLLIDANRFQRDKDRKLALAWACLDNLEASARDQINVMDLTEYENVSLRLKDSETWLKLGDSYFKEKFESYAKNLALFKTYGPLEYIDFRYEGRFVLRPILQKKRNNALDSEKEAF